MKKYKKIILSVLAIFVVLIIVPFFIPMDTYLNKAEKMASESLGVPVTIKKAQLSFLPTPRINADAIVVGEHSDVTISHLSIIPGLLTIFSEQRVIDVKLSNVTIKKAALAIFGVLSQSSGNPSSSPVLIERLSINKLILDFPGTALPVTNVAITLNKNTMTAATISAVDGSLSAVATPKKGAQHISLKLKRFKLPTEMPLVLSTGEFDLWLKGSELDIPNFRVGLYGGIISGDAKLSWVNVWRTSGKFSIESISLKEPSRNANPNTYMTGFLSGNGTFSAAAKEASHLADAIQLKLPFTVKNGVLHGLDLVKAASLVLKQDNADGQTQFDAFSGQLNMRGSRYQLSNLKVSSGLLTAEGHVTISPSNALDGEVDVALKKSVGLVEVPLVVTGSLENPMVLPSKSALAGAVAGTAVLGPGVGTSLGIKASKSINKLKQLFGADED